MRIPRRSALLLGMLIWLLLGWAAPGPAAAAGGRIAGPAASAAEAPADPGQARVTVEVLPPAKPPPKPGKLPLTDGGDLPVAPLVLAGLVLIVVGLLLRRAVSR
jgi:hypothetical protein